MMKRRKAPGVRAKERGTKLPRGAAVQVVIYPRPGSKAVLVKASRVAKQSLSSFVVKAGLEKSAVLLKSDIADLVPQSELEQYV